MFVMGSDITSIPDHREVKDIAPLIINASRGRTCNCCKCDEGLNDGIDSNNLFISIILFYGLFYTFLRKKNNMHKLIPYLFSVFLLVSCKKDKSPGTSLDEQFVELGTHKLATYTIASDSKYLVVFESGLGNDHAIWQNKKVAEGISVKSAIVIYDRAGYGKSTIDHTARDINRLRIELELVVNQYAKGRKVVLVGHSLGGMVIRDYAIKNAEKVAGLLFVDPSHESVLHPTQAAEDILYNSMSTTNGPDFGGTKETRQLIEDAQYMATLGNLPDIPVVVLTGMQLDAGSTGNTQDLYNAHELLKSGVTDFTHIADTKSGHFIMIDNPGLVIENFNLLFSKLP